MALFVTAIIPHIDLPDITSSSVIPRLSLYAVANASKVLSIFEKVGKERSII